MRYVEIPFTVEANYAGWRLDRYLQEKLKRASRAQVQRLIREQLVQRGPRRLKASTPVTPVGMVVVLRRPEVPEPAGIPDRLPVLFDDGRVLVVDKPAGLPVHPTARYYLGTATTILGGGLPGRRGRSGRIRRIGWIPGDQRGAGVRAGEARRPRRSRRPSRPARRCP